MIGSTRSGKSVSEVPDVVAAAERRDIAIVLLDPHTRSLGWSCLEHLIARGHQSRIIFDNLSHFDRVPAMRFLRPSTAKHPLKRMAENEQTARQFTEVLTRRRGGGSLAHAPQTEEWTMHAAMLVIHQEQERPATDLRFAYQANHPELQELIQHCTHDDTRYRFEQVADGIIKPGQYAAAARLIEGVCGSPPFIARCGTSFDLYRFLDSAGILIVEGGANGVSEDALSTVLGSIAMQTINYVRTRRRPSPRVLLVLDEAVNAGLVGGTEVRALAECQKMGLDIHILVQSLNFPNSYITDGVLSNCVRHDWFYQANASVCNAAAADLGSPDYRDRIRTLGIGERFVKCRDKVYRERVHMLNDPWGVSGIAKSKARNALKEIYQRPEYWSPSCSENDSQSGYEKTTPQEPQANNPAGSISTSAKRGTRKFSALRRSTSSSPGMFSVSSPALRLATEDSVNSEKDAD
ncbi:type IV secretory system conjugative DNA transfer family protein [Gimesia alba]|uniref:hypothetical protein n=1 Tax=Gimesia alba TaxID=2527973 RepID=UPI0011A41C02|nr:hypothetical protein [Gimesia alba]